MAVRILTDATLNYSALYCSTSDVAFGPLFMDSDDHDSEERAEAFLRFAATDVRRYSDSDLMHLYGQWLAQEDLQYTRERFEQLRRDEAEGVLLDYEQQEYAALCARFQEKP